MLKKIKNKLLMVIHNKYIKKIIKFLLNYMNLMVVAGLFCGCIFFFLVWNKEKSTLSYNTYIILLSLLPMSVLLLFKLLTVIIKNIWFFIFISIISTLYVYAYLFLAIHIGIFAALVSNL